MSRIFSRKHLDSSGLVLGLVGKRSIGRCIMVGQSAVGLLVALGLAVVGNGVRLIVVLDVNSNSGRVNVAVTVDQESAEYWLGQDIENTVWGGSLAFAKLLAMPEGDLQKIASPFVLMTLPPSLTPHAIGYRSQRTDVRAPHRRNTPRTSAP